MPFDIEVRYTKSSKKYFKNNETLLDDSKSLKIRENGFGSHGWRKGKQR